MLWDKDNYPFIFYFNGKNAEVSFCGFDTGESINTDVWANWVTIPEAFQLSLTPVLSMFFCGVPVNKEALMLRLYAFYILLETRIFHASHTVCMLTGSLSIEAGCPVHSTLEGKSEWIKIKWKDFFPSWVPRVLYYLMHCMYVPFVSALSGSIDLVSLPTVRSDILLLLILSSKRHTRCYLKVWCSLICESVLNSPVQNKRIGRKMYISMHHLSSGGEYLTLHEGKCYQPDFHEKTMSCHFWFL